MSVLRAALDRPRDAGMLRPVLRGGAGGAGGDADALAYLAAVEAEDGEALEAGVRAAVIDFVVGLKADGLWPRMIQMCIMCGPRTLDGALTPVVGPKPDGPTFAPSDYDRATGLKGDGSSKHLFCNVIHDTIPQNDIHLSVEATETFAGGYIGCGLADAGATAILPNASVSRARVQAAALFTSALPTAPGFFGISRAAAANFQMQVGAAQVTEATASQTPLFAPLRVFARGTGSPSDYTQSRLRFFSVGFGLDLAALRTRVDALLAAINAALLPVSAFSAITLGGDALVLNGSKIGFS